MRSAGGCVAQLLVHSNFFKFVIERVSLAQVMRIAELPNKVSSPYKHALFIVLIVRLMRAWKPRELDGAGDPGGVEELYLCDPIHDEQF